MSDKRELFDIFEVELKPPHRMRVLDTNKTEENAEACINFAVIRRGCENHFYIKKQAGTYQDGDTLK